MPVSSDTLLIEREQALPGLGVVLSSEAMQSLLADAGWLDPSANLRGVYARYKPATSCLIGYQIEEESAPARSLYAVARRGDATEKLAKTAHIAHRTTAGRCAVFADLALAVYEFPLDHHMPALSTLVDSTGLRRLFKHLDIVVERGHAPVTVQILRYKPERRCVAQVSVGEKRWLIKLYANRSAFDHAHCAAQLDGGESFQLAKLTGASKTLQALAWGWLDGYMLNDLAVGDGATLDAYVAAGAALAEMHSRPERHLRRYKTETEYDALIEAANAISALAPYQVVAIDTHLKRLMACLNALEPAYALIHGDFSPEQVMVNRQSARSGAETTATFLDLDRAGYGHPAADIGSLAAWLLERNLNRPSGRALVDSAMAAFLDGYASVSTPPDALAIHTHTAMRFLRLCPEAFRRRDDAHWIESLDQRLAVMTELLDQLRPTSVHAVGHVPCNDDPTQSLRAPTQLEVEAHVAAQFSLRGPLHLKRAWPKRNDHTALEYVDSLGRIIPAQWFADADTCTSVARATRCAAGGHGATEVVHEGHVLLQIGGADRKLTGLAPLLSQPHAHLIVHRPERRAVVRLDSEAEVRYAKIVTPARAAEIAEQLTTLQTILSGRLRIPRLCDVDVAQGVVVMSALPGRPLYALLDEPILPELLVESGRALRVLHDSALPANAAVHDARGEQSVIHRWLARVSEFAPHLAPTLTRHAKRVLVALDAPEGDAVLLHRDFYDKQIIVDQDRSIGLLDFDTLAAGEAALDVANALVHLHLRAVQREWSTEHLFRACRSLLDGYAADDAILRRLPTYADATRLRLACVYAMRPSKADVVLALVQSIGKPVAGL